MDRTADWIACYDLVIAFCDLTDAGDAAGQLALFTDDAILSPIAPMEMRGKEQISAVFTHLAEMNKTLKQRHVASNVRVQFTGDDSAVATAILSMYQFHGGPVVPGFMVNETNELRKVDGKWLIASKRGVTIAGQPPMPPGPPGGMPPGAMPPGGPGGPGGPGMTPPPGAPA
jgi:uncharacterized protein (TIGR02246 family)